MPGWDSDIAIGCLWVLAVLAVGWHAVPAFIAALGGCRFSNWGIEDSTEPDPAGEDFALWRDQILKLGYRPVGSGWVRSRYFGANWQVTTSMRIFFSPAAKSHVCIAQLPAPVPLWHSVQFAVPLTDGGMVDTLNRDFPPPDFDRSYLRQGRRISDLAELEMIHRATLEICLQNGRSADSNFSLETLLDSARRNCGPEARVLAADLGWKFLFLHGLIHSCASIPAAMAFGFAHIGVPLTNLGLWCVLAGTQYLQVGYRIEIARMEMRAARAVASAKIDRTSPADQIIRRKDYFGPEGTLDVTRGR